MPSDRLRLFIAFDVPEEHRRRVQEAIEPIRDELPGARWTSIESQHVTLKFIGWVEPAQLDPILTTTRDVAAAHAASYMRVTGIGAFPSKKRVRVLWAGIEDPSGLGPRLAGDLSARLEPLGIEREERAFTPHLTLARLKTPKRMDEDALDVDLGELAPFLVDEVVLYRSHLSGKGARYEAIDRCPLA
jgi:RNA 2',3'-cyclic 3'-phosphodiesterase